MRTNIRVGAIIFHDGQLITTKMRYNNKVFYVLPGGGVELNETIYEAIIREVKEEVDIDIINFHLVYIKETNTKVGRGVEFYFYVSNFKGEPKTGLDPEEKESILEEVCFLNLDYLKEVVFHPKELINILEKDKKLNFSNVKYLGLEEY